MAVGRAKEKDAEANAEERAQARASIGALTWAAKEGRPDAAATAIASCLNKMKIQDVLDLNRTIRDLKNSSTMALKVQPINPKRMEWCGALSQMPHTPMRLAVHRKEPLEYSVQIRVWWMMEKESPTFFTGSQERCIEL